MLYAVASVVSVEQISSQYGVLTLHEYSMAQKAKPGQFSMLTPYKVEDEKTSSLFLKRPISIFSVNKDQGFISYYYQVMGKGTRFFSSLKEGDKISVLGPLGRGFQTRFENKNLLFVGAGVGTAPFKYLYDTLSTTNPSIYMVFGGRDEYAVKARTSFAIPDEHMFVITDDGSVGKKGNVVEMTEELLQNPPVAWDYVYVCGPNIVLKKVGELLSKYDIPGQLSLEGYMACGVRACQACSVETKYGSQKTCSFGPVFDVQNLVLESI